MYMKYQQQIHHVPHLLASSCNHFMHLFLYYLLFQIDIYQSYYYLLFQIDIYPYFFLLRTNGSRKRIKQETKLISKLIYFIKANVNLPLEWVLVQTQVQKFSDNSYYCDLFLCKLNMSLFSPLLANSHLISLYQLLFFCSLVAYQVFVLPQVVQQLGFNFQATFPCFGLVE